MKRPIGIFDSGLGGLTVLYALQKAYPEESFIYMGDTKRAPWGSKSREELVLVTDEIVDFLTSKHIKSLVVACNTSCSLVFDHISKKTAIPTFGLIEPSCKDAINKTLTNRIAVLGTTGTISSKAYTKTLTSLHPSLDILELECPELVPFVESNQITSQKSISKVTHYLDKVQNFGADTLILGCTHYPFFQPLIRSIHPNLTLVNPANSILSVMSPFMISSSHPTIEFWVSGNPDSFSAFISEHFNWPTSKVKQYQPTLATP
ncbi:MAG: glutamate racemase [Candidatus Margulisbacteria bacterium]|nr:glutamate racemase [Candidatus Margulisiibacteriota bacterium]